MNHYDDDQALSDYQQRLVQARRDALWRQVEANRRQEQLNREIDDALERSGEAIGTANLFVRVLCGMCMAGAVLLMLFALGFAFGQVVEWVVGGRGPRL